jgi:hypothetical protein
MKETNLQDVLNKGKGIALICYLIECPNCNKDIWVEIGHHCGFDAVLKEHIKTECYKCFNNIDVYFDKDIKIKDMIFMTIEDYNNLKSK